MRVRISYSVELEHVPQEVVRILDGSLDKICLIRDEIETLMYDIENDTTNAHRVGKIIQELRQDLARLDHELTDSDSIIQGYYKTTAKPEITGDRDSVSEG